MGCKYRGCWSFLWCDARYWQFRIRTDCSSGKYQLIMQSDGNLVLYTRQYLPNSPYWSTQTLGDDFELFFNQSGSVIVITVGEILITSVFSNVVSSDQYYQRLTLDYDGVLRHYVYPKSSSSTGGRPMAWSVFEFLPPNICLSILQLTGGGICGYNSLCSIGNDSKPVCKCPTGYSLEAPNDSLSGCKPDFVPQICDNKLNETGNFGYNEMLNTDWPLSHIEHFQNVSEDWCRQVCLSDCSCGAVTFDNGNCSILKPPLSNGRTDASLRGTALIKVRYPPPDHPPPSGTGTSSIIKNKKSSKSLTIIIVVCVIVTLLLLTLSLCAFIARRTRQKAKTGVEEDEEELPVGTTQYDFALIRAATEDFSTANMLGKGGFGAVYKGVLSDGKVIAVKRLSTTSSQGEKEFRNEVKLLAKLQHNCLVRLLGFCLERTERLLIYEFMKNGSLDKILFDPEHRSRLDWEGRYRIIKSIARGLLYLHEDSRLMIIHRDLKASNILLDEEMNAKISDFGLARLFVPDDSQVFTKRVAGTLGYMSPEYAMHGLFSVKSDVYSFGVLLLEIVSGKRNYYSVNEDVVEGLLSYAYKAWKEGKASDLIDPVVTALDSHSLETVMRCIHIALLCVQDNVGSRPTMASIVGMLQSLTVTLPTPFEPGFFRYTSSNWPSGIQKLAGSSSHDSKQPKSVHNAAHNDPPSWLQEETDSILYPR